MNNNRLWLIIFIIVAVIGMVAGAAQFIDQSSEEVYAQVWPGGGGDQLIYGVPADLTPIPVKVSKQSSGVYGAIDVYIQDQHTQVLLSPFLVPTGITATLSVTAGPGDWSITVTPTDGIIATDTIAFGKAGAWWDGKVYTKTGGILSLDQSINVTYELGTQIKVFTGNLAMDGSVVRIVSKVYPVPGGIDFDIVEMHLNMVCTGEPDDSKFCDLDALTRGIALRYYNGETGTYENLGNAKGGAHAVRAACQFREDAGVTVRLRGATTGAYTPFGRDELHFIIQDDLTSIISINVVLIGHVVAD